MVDENEGKLIRVKQTDKTQLKKKSVIKKRQEGQVFKIYIK